MRTTAITISNDATTDFHAKDAVKEEESSVCSRCCQLSEEELSDW